MSITIRRATEADAEALRSIYAPYVADTTITFEYEVPSVSEFAGRIRAFGAEYPYLVCEKDGEAIGYAYADRVRERAAYDWDVELSVYLRQGTHGRGIGTVLLACLVELLEMQGIRHLYSCVTMPNEKSVRMQKSSASRTRDAGRTPAGNSARGMMLRGSRSTSARANPVRSRRFPSSTIKKYRKRLIHILRN